MYTEILNYINTLEIIDTHEHLPAWEKLRDCENDVFSEYFIHYFPRDIISAGIDKDKFAMLCLNNCLSIAEKWEIAEKFWEHSRYTGYGQALAVTARDIYGIEDINGSTIEKLNDEFKKTQKQNDYFKFILKEKSKIKTSLLDNESALESDRSIFTPIKRIDSMINPGNSKTIEVLTEKTGVKVTAFDDYLNACGAYTEFLIKNTASLKSAIAYERTLSFETSDYNLAKKEFDTKVLYGNDKFKLSLEFQNYIWHHLMKKIDEHGAAIQIHTGIQEGNGNTLYNSNPRRLNNLFLEYPNIKFDVFHMGYPYQNELGALAKMFPNVYIDMCWAHIISPVACVNALSEWIELMPINKINGFGGDYCFVDGVYGHQKIARQNIAKALTIKVKDGLFGVEKACELAKRILVENPSELFGV